MCGILGTTEPVTSEAFGRALDLIAHRGPDDYGVQSFPNLTLGHRRLAIQDLSPNGHQPMSILDGTLTIVFNGEIYNHLEIRSKLKGNYSYRSSSDTETLLYAYLENGPGFIESLNGIFAFGIYDARSQELLVARDPLGVKPLYYCEHNGSISFASEIKSLLGVSRVSRDLSVEALADYIQFLWSPGERTPFANIKKLLPGYTLTKNLRDGSPTKFSKYYEIPFSGGSDLRPESELIEELDMRLQTAVRRQLLSDVPIGFFLSGGLDSSLIAAIARKQSGSSFNCYTIKIPGKDTVDGFADDLEYARKAAKHLDTRLIEVESDYDIVRDFDQMIWHLDEPQADPAPLHVLNICKAARENKDIVLLGGTAGDDLFSGYRRHQALNLERWFQLIPGGAGKAIGQLLNLLPSSVPSIRRLQKLGKGLGSSALSRMATYYCWMDWDRSVTLFQPSYRDRLKDYDPLFTFYNSLNSIPKETRPLNQMLFWDMKYFLADHNLNYTDKMSMAHGIEVRVPFLDLELIEFANSLPVQMKMNGNCTKYILRKVAERYLPHDIIYRPKTGFGAPIRRWMNEGYFDDPIRNLVDSSASAFTQYFSRDAISQLVSSTKNNQLDGSYTIWSLLAIESWMRSFVKL